MYDSVSQFEVRREQPTINTRLIGVSCNPNTEEKGGYMELIGKPIYSNELA